MPGELNRETLLRAIRQWWFLPILLLPQLIPPFASQGYRIMEWPAVNQYIITHPVKVDLSAFYPIFKIVPLLLMVGLFSGIKPVSRLFYTWVALVFGLAAILQSVSVSSKLGWAICTGNLVMFLILALLWGKEALKPSVSLTFRQNLIHRWWLLLLALVAFWFPVNPQTMKPDFNPMYMILSGAGLSFCLSTPLFLAILLLASPWVNKTLIACTSFVGLFVGLSNLVLEWLIIPVYWWIGVLHLPLVILSVTGLRQSISENRLAGREPK